MRIYNGRRMTQYRESCNRILETLVDVIRPTFAGSPNSQGLCDIAIKAVHRMNRNESGSGVPLIISNTVFRQCDGDNPITNGLNAEQCLLP